jgi:hypothetical protein
MSRGPVIDKGGGTPDGPSYKANSRSPRGSVRPYHEDVDGRVVMVDSKPDSTPAPAEPPWNDQDAPDWTNAVDNEAWIDRDVDFIKELPCPRCRHTMWVKYSGGAEGLFKRRLSQSDEPSVAATCNCETRHIGAPANRKGCGRKGWINSPTPKE